MPREARLFQESDGSVAEAYLLLLAQGTNIPASWIDRSKESRKNREELLAELLHDNSLDAVEPLRDWELAYRKECFYRGLRALLELKRDGKTTL
ncbi:MAG: hypothetical protein KGL31_12030 [candidate division NC10 bacterium]|nr:hypothetical protein [candidate division NC10 bacterium]MDE2322620.1 hypothetical protein [candidate division NC10 bacterium]